MSFIRPEAFQTLLRWREVLVGVAVVGLGLWWSLGAFGLWRWMAIALILAGLAITWEGLRRARFKPGTGGPGVVEVDERQITYFGPSDGGAISIDGLARVVILTTDEGPFVDDVFWVFEDGEGAILHIPASAEGAETLFDAISVLPGVDYEAVLKAMGSTENAQYLVWDNAQKRLH